MYKNFFGDRLRELRQTAGVTQKEVADYVGVSISQISCWETGAAKPTEDRLNALIEFFAIPTDYFSCEIPQDIPQYIIDRGKREIGNKLTKSPESSKSKVSRILGISENEIEMIEKNFSGIAKVAEYSKLVKDQIENLRRFQNVIDSYIGKVNERFLELEDLRKRAIKLAEEVAKDSDDVEFQFLNVKASE